MSISEGGEVYVPKIPSYRIDCIAKAMAPDCEHPIIGRRPGEKIHEVMVPEDDAYRTWELEDRYSIEPDWAQGKIDAGTRRGWVQQAGKKVPNDFNYDSGINTEWVTVGDLKHLYKLWAYQVLGEEITVPAGMDDDFGSDLHLVECSTLTTYTPKEGQAEAFTAALVDFAKQSRSESGCCRADVLKMGNGAVLFYEGYSSSMDLEQHEKQEYTVGFKAAAESMATASSESITNLLA